MHIQPTKLPYVSILIAFSLIGASGCSKSEPSATQPEAASASAMEETTPPTPAPTLGTVEGNVRGEKSGTPLENRMVVLCELSEGLECLLRPTYTSTTDAAGTFTIHDVVPGRYTIVHAPFQEGALPQLEDGLAIDPTRGEIKVLSGTIVDIGADGLDNVRGAVEYIPAGLTFEFREGKLGEIEVRAGEISEVNIRAWAF